MDLTPRLLEQFVVLVEEKHYGRAAQRLSMSQPPLSQAIARLERGLGVALVESSTRGVQITAAGEAFAEDARQLLDEQAAAVERVRRIAHGLEGSLRIGFITSLAYWLVPRLVVLATAELPRLQLHLRLRSSVELVAAIRSGAMDLAFARTPLIDTGDLEIREIATERVGIVVPPGHRFEGAESVALADLADEDLALPSQQVMPGLYRQVMGACREAGFTPRVRATGDDLGSIVCHVAAGTCVGFVPYRPLAQERYVNPGIPLRDESGYLETRVVALSRPGADIAIDRMLELVERCRREFLPESQAG